MWVPDKARDEARKQPGWLEFHRACGKNALYFDIPSRDRGRGPFTVVAFTARRNEVGGYITYELARATGQNLVKAMARAHEESGRASPETTALVERMINPPAEPVVDPMAAMFGDPIESMFG